MAKNKITHEFGESGSIIITGSVRQPTMVEIKNYLGDLNLEGAYAVGFNVTGEWTPPEHALSITLWPYFDSCPTCGKDEMFRGANCPVCLQKWPE